MLNVLLNAFLMASPVGPLLDPLSVHSPLLLTTGYQHANIIHSPINIQDCKSLTSQAQAQVTATGTMGVTNPPQATMGTSINQTSDARLLSVNSIDDLYVPITSGRIFAVRLTARSCIFGPPEPNSVIGNTEEIEVAWCVRRSHSSLPPVFT